MTTTSAFMYMRIKMTDCAYYASAAAHIPHYPQMGKMPRNSNPASNPSRERKCLVVIFPRW